MTQEEFDNIKLPALVYCASSHRISLISKLASHKGQKHGHFIVYSKSSPGNLCSVKNHTDERNIPNGTWWSFKIIDIVQENYSIEREQMLELEKEL